MAGHQGIVVRVLTWNLFHGRDLPLEVDYKRSLRSEFAGRLARFTWDVALLQEAPPRWADDLAFKAGAEVCVRKTSRNQLGRVRGLVAERRPDLIKSNEGGSNQVLFRPPWAVSEERHLTLAHLPERRQLQWLTLEHASGAQLCVANLHASANKPPRAAQELEHAATAALEWSGERPLLLGGDFNVRPAEQPWIFDKLTELGFSGPTGAEAIDHLLVRGARTIKGPHQLPVESRDIRTGGSERVRLSDHAVVVVTFDVE